MAYASVHPAMQALARNAEIAGSAMGCRFQSSAEYEAAVIVERRQAGAYRRTLMKRGRRWPWILCGIVTASALIGLPIIW